MFVAENPRDVAMLVTGRHQLLTCCAGRFKTL